MAGGRAREPAGGARRSFAAGHVVPGHAAEPFAADLSHIAHLEAQRYHGHDCLVLPRRLSSLVPPAGGAP